MRYNRPCVCGRSSSGRARPCQGRGSEFEPRRPLHKKQDHPMGGPVFCDTQRAEARKGTSAARKTCRGHVLVPVCVSRRGSAASEPRRLRAVIERARETRLKFSLHTFPSLRYAGMQTAKPADSQKEDHSKGVAFFFGNVLRAGLNPPFVSSGAAGNCRRCGRPPAR